MKSSALCLAVFASLASLAQAQEVTVPQGFADTNTGNTTLLWRSTAFHFQCVYDVQHFANQNLDHGIEITRLRFRPINGAIDAGGQIYTGVTITLSTSPYDSQTMDTTFTNNVGTDVVTVFNGDVTLLPAAGGSPNDNNIDIVLQTPFLYNSNSGPLIVDVLAPNAPTAAVPNCAASNNFTTQFARRLSTAVVTDVTGALSGFAAAMTIDYNIPAGTALRSTYGNGCYERQRMVYEKFVGGTVSDLIGSNTSMLYQPNSLGGYYIVIQNGGIPYTTPGPGAVDLLTMGFTSSSSANWDDASIVMTPTSLASGFPYPNAGSNTATDITINSNGKVYLGNTVDPAYAVNGANYGGLDPFSGVTGSGLPVLAAFDVDLDPTVGGNIWYEDPSPNGGVRITWDNIANWQDTTFTGLPAGPNSFQMELLPNGQINYAYGAALTTGGSASNDAIVGFSAGGAEPTTTMVDWSSLLAYQTGDGLNPIVLSVDARPILGSSINMTTSNIPATSIGSVNILSVVQLPGIDLGIIGMPGCEANVDITGASIDFSPGSPTASRLFAIPTTPALSGLNLFSQALVLAAGVNQFNGLTSNGVALKLGTL